MGNAVILDPAAIAVLLAEVLRGHEVQRQGGIPRIINPVARNRRELAARVFRARCDGRTRAGLERSPCLLRLGIVGAGISGLVVSVPDDAGGDERDSRLRLVSPGRAAGPYTGCTPRQSCTGIRCRYRACARTGGD